MAYSPDWRGLSLLFTCFLSCLVIGNAQATQDGPPLDEYVGWLVVIGFGLVFTLITMWLQNYEEKVVGTKMTSEHFNTAGRNVGAGLTAAVIVSQWTWAATLLQSSNMGWRVGVSGPFWYASGATIQILLFAILAIQVKRRCSHMHTFLEVIRARWGTTAHIVFLVFALLANCIVTAMLLLGGSAVIEDLTGMRKEFAAFLVPLLSCLIYTLKGGLRATFFASYIHTTIIFVVLLIFTYTIYTSGGDGAYGSIENVFNSLTQNAEHAFFNSNDPTTGLNEHPFINGMVGNDGQCYTSDQTLIEGTTCSYREVDECTTGPGCVKFPVGGQTQQFAGDCSDGETCVSSFLTMSSTTGIIFGVVNIVGNFGTVFVDQSYWQSAIAAKPKATVPGFLIGGLVWFAVPFGMATTMGLAGRAIATEWGWDFISAEAAGAGLVPARVLTASLGSGGAFVLLLMLFMAITSTGSAELIAVSSILTYDLYWQYINPELKYRRTQRRMKFYKEVARVLADEDEKTAEKLDEMDEQSVRQRIVSLNEQRLNRTQVTNLIARMQDIKVLDDQLTEQDLEDLVAYVLEYDESMDGALVKDVYHQINRRVATEDKEGHILLRVSKFFTVMFAIFMGFLAVMLQVMNLSLGYVYMAMGVFIGSAVAPSAMCILSRRANGKVCTFAALAGLVCGLAAWFGQTGLQYGEVSLATTNQDFPFIAGNLASICVSLVICVVGSFFFPDRHFQWEMLNEKIPLVDDVEPPKDPSETPENLYRWYIWSLIAAVGMTIVLVILWPLPMHFIGGVFSFGQFSAWVGVAMAWSTIAAVVIVFMPLWELYRGLQAGRSARIEHEKHMMEVASPVRKIVEHESGNWISGGTSPTVDYTPTAGNQKIDV
ncbi:unnamed protein product [Vitrella brassicaformis CCMP3155]|uniref:Urea transporter n=2 Tax=Vitrella brassicaformis TaxID=1169539 RepID=A0A0G4FFG2_VITBC|nr:unnamed protein product [Vitrella brassicaformis CCMP3155]|mmetsp:Transcript_49488/g.124124  ORF Transcript_49488/g.124124 Transcript_49488/m.124124 type:complete len:881 (+) Transcript_49488:98-2740(+)|eukprot:CEM11925.1 unnamed protein product [Vitrella brassicaformis CCMP3155]